MLFKMSDKEYETYQVWKAVHDEKCPLKSPEKQGAIGGRTTFSFTPTGLGMIIGVECACGETMDVTDSEDW